MHNNNNNNHSEGGLAGALAVLHSGADSLGQCSANRCANVRSNCNACSVSIMVCSRMLTCLGQSTSVGCSEKALASQQLSERGRKYDIPPSMPRGVALCIFKPGALNWTSTVVLCIALPNMLRCFAADRVLVLM